MKKIMITGARNGIARKVIKKLLKQDYYIYVTVHTKESCSFVQKKYKRYENVECFVLDITKEEDREKVREIDIDILVNNAAIGESGSIAEIPIEKVRENFEVNVFASFELIQCVLPQMIQKGQGKIIMMSSLASLVPFAFLGVYSATKASINTLACSLQKELKLLDVHIPITLIQPGFYETGFNRKMFDTKYEWMNKDSLFAEELKLIRKKENILLSLLEKENLNSIVKKIVKAINQENPKFIYRAPFFQGLGAKLYQIFFH